MLVVLLRVLQRRSGPPDKSITMFLPKSISKEQPGWSAAPLNIQKRIMAASLGGEEGRRGGGVQESGFHRVVTTCLA